ncbi:MULTISPECIES: ribbon-helix-helix protein, CopG family [unclassified Aureimonas]|uniref:ribbon-helix-helix protein, CopG family n=1 Tax=unclassified Aureimonas TaxID=2615206 RepID=UPI0009E68B0B|nr:MULTISPECIES: ribbon-helix-helix protein, CopG family [unclassified Aureimonas]
MATPAQIAEIRARRRSLGLRSTEAVLHENEIAVLDRLKERLGATSRSDVLRVLIAKTDIESLTPADIAALDQSAA